MLFFPYEYIPTSRLGKNKNPYDNKLSLSPEGLHSREPLPTTVECDMTKSWRKGYM